MSKDRSDVPISRAKVRSRRGQVYRVTSFSLKNLFLLCALCLIGGAGWMGTQVFDGASLLSFWGGCLLIGSFCLFLLVREPMRLRLEQEAVVLRYPFRSVRFLYQDIERLHYSKRPSTANPERSKPTLRIELKNGDFHRISSFGSAVRQITRSLETRVYGPTIS